MKKTIRINGILYTYENLKLLPDGSFEIIGKKKANIIDYNKNKKKEVVK